MRRYVLAFAFVLCLMFQNIQGGSLFAQTSAASDPALASSASRSATIAEIDGLTITLADVERKRPSMFQARNAFYDAQRKAIEQYIDDFLLERQAGREKVTVDKLLERHVQSTIPADPPDEALRVYYEGVDTAEPFEVVRGKIIDHIRQRRLAKAKAAYVQSLRKDAKIAVRLAPPRLPVSLENTRIRGSRDSAVTLVEFADYECPYCQQIQPALERVLSDYASDVAFAYKDAPLPSHSRAQKAAEAAHCAGNQGKYWEYHKLLFSTRQLDAPALKKHARELSLDGAAFDACLDSGAEAARVQDYFSEAQNLGLPGTPTLFINGRLVSGLVTYEQLREVVEEELRAAVPARTGQ